MAGVPRKDTPARFGSLRKRSRGADAARTSYCKLSPESFMNDKPPMLSFRALLTESGAERLEMARA